MGRRNFFWVIEKLNLSSYRGFTVHTYNIVFMQTKKIDNCSDFYTPSYKIRYVSSIPSANVFLWEFLRRVGFSPIVFHLQPGYFLLLIFFLRKNVSYCWYIGCVAAESTIRSVIVFTWVYFLPVFRAKVECKKIHVPHEHVTYDHSGNTLRFVIVWNCVSSTQSF